MPQDEHGSRPFSSSGIDAFIADVSHLACQFPDDPMQKVRFILHMGEAYAFIRLQDVWRPLRFLKQLAGAPPRRFGTAGFASWLVDDANPARHYTAFVFTGFWLPHVLALAVLYAWEIAGFVRYRGYWSPADVLSGQVGIRHGQLVRRYGPAILPALIACDLADRPTSLSTQLTSRGADSQGR